MRFNLQGKPRFARKRTKSCEISRCTELRRLHSYRECIYIDLRASSFDTFFDTFVEALIDRATNKNP